MRRSKLTCLAVVIVSGCLLWLARAPRVAESPPQATAHHESETPPQTHGTQAADRLTTVLPRAAASPGNVSPAARALITLIESDDAEDTRFDRALEGLQPEDFDRLAVQYHATSSSRYGARTSLVFAIAHLKTPQARRFLEGVISADLTTRDDQRKISELEGEERFDVSITSGTLMPEILAQRKLTDWAQEDPALRPHIRQVLEQALRRAPPGALGPRLSESIDSLSNS